MRELQENLENEEHYRDLCFKCMRPKSNCFCKYTKPIDCGVKFVFLMHPKEAKKQRTGTGRLAALSLPRSEIIMGIDFTKSRRLNELLNDPQYYPVFLYPGDDAWNAKKEGFKDVLKGKTLLAILIDSTWFCSKKMLKMSPNVTSLPKFSFNGSYRSIFTFKQEPYEYCVSTIETCYYLIKELQETGIANLSADPEPLMDTFKAMIKFQLQKENDRINGLIPNSHGKDWKYTKLKDIPDYLG